MSWMTALIDQLIGRFSLGTDLDQLLVLRVSLAKVNTEPTLSFLHVNHTGAPFNTLRLRDND